MTSFIFYKCGENERWDNIAYKHYKNTYKITELINANPHIPITQTIPENTEIMIPIEDYNKSEDNSLLPVWKQNNDMN